MTKTQPIATGTTPKLRQPGWLAVVALLAAGRASGSGLPPGSQAPLSPAAGIEVSFKMDPRLTRGLYLGDRWVSPPTFSIHQPAKGATVEAAARVRSASGRRLAIEPRWESGDPDMVIVTPAEGRDVRIAVLRPGETLLHVIAGGVSRSLTVRAAQRGESLRIEISQGPVRAREPVRDRVP